MINELLNIKYPIFCGAMARIARSSLVSAVSNAGGLGIIASGGMSKEELEQEIKKTKKLTDKPFGVNLFLKASNIDELVSVVIKENIKVVTTGAGSPKAFIKKLKENNIIVIPVVQNEIVAKKMEMLGCDAVVVEGTEAGGHIGKLTTVVAVSSVLKEVNIPVIAAGGISDGKTMAAFLAMGCAGVQMGSRFLLCDECEIDNAYKEKIISSKDTVVVGESFSLPVRVIENNLSRSLYKIEHNNFDKDEYENLTLGSLKKAVDGDVENGSLMAGQIIRTLNKKESVKNAVEQIISQCQYTLKNASKIKVVNDNEK